MNQTLADEGDLDVGYRAMAREEVREIEAHEFSEATIGEVGDEER